MLYLFSKPSLTGLSLCESFGKSVERRFFIMPKGVFPRSIEHRQNIGIALTGCKRSLETREKLSIIASQRKLTESQKAKIGEAQKGSKHWNWKGGVTEIVYHLRKTKEYRHWRQSVLQRDNKCRGCGSLSHIQTHHIKPIGDFPGLIFDVNNGLTLCVNCHKEHDGSYRLNRKGATICRNLA